jgi:hypothetical protein
MLKSMALVLGTASVMLFSQNCLAAEYSFRSILEFGCHKNDGTCYVNLDGPPLTGGAGCVGNHIRWDAKNDANGKNWLALMMMAKALNKRVALYIDGCYVNQPSIPTFAYGSIEN